MVIFQGYVSLPEGDGKIPELEVHSWVIELNVAMFDFRRVYLEIEYTMHNLIAKKEKKHAMVPNMCFHPQHPP